MTANQAIRLAAAIALLFAVLACVGCGHGRNPDGEMVQLFRAGEFVGAQVCLTCHGKDQGDWAETLHAHALQTLQNIGEGADPHCLGCHTVGLGQATGFVSAEATPELGGVQCENCHGPGGGHVALQTGGRLRDGESDIVASVSAEVCAQCHEGSHHPFYEEWQASKHAIALPTLRANPHASDSCVECHSTDYRLAPEGQKPTLQTAVYSLTCVACHDPHSDAIEHQLRAEPKDLCIGCHNKQGALPGESVHHPQKEMLLGLDSDGLGDFTNSAHSQIPDLCVVCHRYTRDYQDEQNPGITGHTFEIDFHVCRQCHEGTAAQIEAYARARQDAVKARLAAIEARLTAIPEDLQDTDAYKEAEYFYEFVDLERSYGVHNANYADALMAGAEERLTQLESE
jgi:predicted CXXCH cytochrome family protein